MSKVYSIIEFESNIHKEMVVEYLLDGEKAGDLPDIAMWSYHSLSKLAKKVEDMQVDALIDASASYFMEEADNNDNV
jgi:hypothetical protein